MSQHNSGKIIMVIRKYCLRRYLYSQELGTTCSDRYLNMRISDILGVPTNIPRGNPYKMTNLKFVRGFSNFAKFSTIKSVQVAKI